MRTTAGTIVKRERHVRLDRSEVCLKYLRKSEAVKSVAPERPHPGSLWLSLPLRVFTCWQADVMHAAGHQGGLGQGCQVPGSRQPCHYWDGCRSSPLVLGRTRFPRIGECDSLVRQNWNRKSPSRQICRGRRGLFPPMDQAQVGLQVNAAATLCTSSHRAAGGFVPGSDMLLQGEPSSRRSWTPFCSVFA